MSEKRQCDKCGTTGTSKTIHGLRKVMGDGMSYFCEKCWKITMKWRKVRNERLPSRSQYPTPPWRD